MQKKSKTIFTAVVTALFVLSVSYFALLAPTTAWYYQREDKSLTFDFGNFNMSQSTSAASSETVKLRGTTRFADKGEILFDEMIHLISVTATNNGDMAGNISVRIKDGNTELNVDDTTGNARGLKWFVYESPQEVAASLGSPAANSLKIANTFNEQLAFSITFTAAEAATISKNGSSHSLTVGSNTITFDVASGAVYTFSGLPSDIPYALTVNSNKPVGAVGEGKTMEGTVPSDGKNIKIQCTPKTSIDDMLNKANSSWPIDYNTLTGNTETAYETYNASAISTLKAHNKSGITVPANSTKTVNIAFWAEYGDLKTPFEVTSEPAKRTITTKYFRGSEVEGRDPVTYNDLTVEIVASPDTGGTQTATLTLETASGVSDPTNVSLYQWSGSAWTLYTGDYEAGGSTHTAGSTGVIAVPTTGATTGAQIRYLPVGTRFKLVTDSQTSRFDGSPTTETNADCTEITGTLSNGGSTVKIISTLEQTPTLTISSTASTATTVTLYRWVNNAWAAFSGTYQTLDSSGAWSSAATSFSGGQLTIPAKSSLRVSVPSAMLTATERYKLEITGASPTAVFDDSGKATQIIGKITGLSNEVLIVPNA